MKMNHEIAFNLCPTPMPVLSAPASSEIADEETLHHTITIPEPHVCRICEPDDEDENGQGQVELGCQCKGEMSRMHRTCFLEWFGTRMLLTDNYYCEVCNSMLPFKTQMVMAEAVGDLVNGGRRILMKGLKRHMELRVFALADGGVNYEELVQVLAQNALELSQTPHQTANDVEMLAQAYHPSRCEVFVVMVVGVVVTGAVTVFCSYMARFPSTFMY